MINIETFAGRMERNRMNFGSRGSHTSVRQWAKDLKVTHGKARDWEDGRNPRGGLDELVQAFENLATRGPISARELAAWTFTGSGPTPSPGTEHPTPAGGTPVSVITAHDHASMVEKAASLLTAELRKGEGRDRDKARVYFAAIQEGVAQIGRAAAFYPGGEPIDSVTTGTEIDETASSPFGVVSTPLTVNVRRSLMQNAA